jgi:hypothetical protein
MALPFLVPTLVAPARSVALSNHLDTVRPTLETAAGLSLVAIGALVIPIGLISGMAGRW